MRIPVFLAVFICTVAFRRHHVKPFSSKTGLIIERKLRASLKRQGSLAVAYNPAKT